ncbi:copper resistance CopC family protein [Gracilibacillus massiliensis]|uniref:copper resistance CopC family protein n=1 Tax=Gracilibacillus massiliensis TaxID=1564956 RepID=UPI00071D058D|nr:copper resistance protein CopC [Gracilibacillus massiliensis]
MKRVIIMIIGILLISPLAISVPALSHLEESNPSDGEEVMEQVEDIVLIFDGAIEEGSTLAIANTSGEAIDVQDTIIDESTLTATLSQPLPNDEYEVNWSIISTDGHPLEGNFMFTVNAPVTEETQEEEASEQSEVETSEDETLEEETTDTTESETSAADNEETESTDNMFFITLFIVVVIFAVVGMILMIKRRK